MIKPHVSIRLVGCLVAALLFARPVHAEPADWPQWRGPTHNGASAAANLPEKLDPKSAAWAAELPGPGAGTPIVHGDRVFVSALDKASKKLLAICVSRKDGKTLWQHEVANGFQTNPRNNMASPSPVTDGKLVFFHYASGDLVAFDYDGKEVWKKNLVQQYGPFNYMWIYGSSPLLYEGKLFVQVLHNTKPYRNDKGPNPAESYLLALDPATGKELWRQIRPDEAKDESKESYGTPTPFEHDGKKEVVVSGGDAVTGHDPETGRELWRFGGWNPEKIGHWRMVSSVTTGADLVFASPPKNGKFFAIKANGQGDVTDSHLAWRSNDLTTDVCAPLFYNGKLYVLDGDNRKKLSCIEPKTGKVQWSGELKSRQVFRASPTAGDGKIYCMNEDGRVWVVSADAFKVLYEGDLGEEAGPARASIALADGQAFVRTADKLYCFGGK